MIYGGDWGLRFGIRDEIWDLRLGFGIWIGIKIEDWELRLGIRGLRLGDWIWGLGFVLLYYSKLN